MSVNLLALFWLKEVINHCHDYTAKTEIFVSLQSALLSVNSFAL